MEDENNNVPGGFTWTTQVKEEEIHDRIDFVYFKVGSLFVQPVKAYLVDKLKYSFVQYPSDHRAVVIDFKL